MGIDIGEVTLAEEPGFLAATLNIASIGDYENWNVTARDSLQSATENAQFMVSVRNAETAAETAGSLTPRAAAAARSDPSSATSANVRSWVNVIARGLITGGLSRC